MYQNPLCATDWRDSLMRSLIIAALLVPPMASAPFEPTNTQLLTNATTQQAIFLNKTALAKNLAPDMRQFIAQTSGTEPAAQTKIPSRTKKAARAQCKNNSQRMDIVTFLLMLKKGKQ